MNTTHRKTLMVFAFVASGIALFVGSTVTPRAAPAATSHAAAAGKAKSKVFKVGLDNVLSGPLSFLQEYANGAIAYMKYVNSRGGIHGYKYKWTSADTGLTATGGITATKQLVESDHVNAVIGIGTIVAQALKPLAPQLKVPLFIAGNGALYVPPVKNMFDVAPNFNSIYAAEYALARKVGHGGPVGVVYENDAVGQPAKQSIPIYALKHHVPSAAVMDAISTGTTDCTPFAARMQSRNVAAVILAADVDLAACVVKAAGLIGYNPTWVGNYGEVSSTYASELGPQYAGQAVIDFQTPVTSKTRAAELFTRVMDKYFKADAKSAFSEQGWDAASVLTRALRLATRHGHAATTKRLLRVLSHKFKGQKVGLLSGVAYNAHQHYGIVKGAQFVTTAGGGERQITKFAALPPPYGSGG